MCFHGSILARNCYGHKLQIHANYRDQKKKGRDSKKIKFTIKDEPLSERKHAKEKSKYVPTAKNWLGYNQQKTAKKKI